MSTTRLLISQSRHPGSILGAFFVDCFRGSCENRWIPVGTQQKDSTIFAIYARQSDPNKKAVVGMDNTLSIETQIDECAKHGIKLDLGTQFEIYKEQITSEVFDDRPELSRLIAKIDKYEAVIVYKYDRIVRDPNQLTLFVQMIRAKGVRVISTNEAEPAANPLGDMILFIHGTFVKMTKIAIKENTQKTKKKLQSEGKIVGGGQCLYGYKYNMELRTREIVPHQEEVVRRIFNFVCDGKSLRQIADKLNLEGVKGPRTIWKVPTLSMIVRDPSYHGAPFMADKKRPTETRLPSGKRLEVRQSSEHHRPIGEGTPQIVTREVWDDAQVFLSDRKKRPKSKLQVWLRGHVFCGHCGAAMTPSGDKGGHTFRCNRTAHAKHLRVPKCGNTSFNLAMVEEKVWEKVVRVCEDRPYLESQINEALGNIAKPDHEKELTDRRAKVAKMNAKMQRLMSAWGDEEDSIKAESLNALVDKIAEEVKVEEGLIGEIESVLAVTRQKESLIRNVQAITESIDAVKDADYEKRCKIMDVLSIRVELDYRSANERLEPGLQEALKQVAGPDYQAFPGAPRHKQITTKIFAVAPGSPSVKRKFSR